MKVSNVSVYQNVGCIRKRSSRDSGVMRAYRLRGIFMPLTGFLFQVHGSRTRENKTVHLHAGGLATIRFVGWPFAWEEPNSVSGTIAD